MRINEEVKKRSTIKKKKNLNGFACVFDINLLCINLFIPRKIQFMENSAHSPNWVVSKHSTHTKKTQPRSLVAFYVDFCKLSAQLL